MAEAHARISGIRRLAVVAGGVCLLAGAGAPAAVAGLELPAPPDSGLATRAIPDLTEMREEAIETTAPASDVAPLEELEEAARPALEGPLPEVVAPLSQTVNDIPQRLDQPLPVAPVETVEKATETLSETTAPVLDHVQQAQLLSGAVETLTAVTESPGVPLPLTQPLPPETLPVLGAALDATTPALRGVDVTTKTEAVRHLLETTQPVVTAASTPPVATDVPARESSPLAEIGPARAVETSPFVPPPPPLSATERAPISSSREKLALPPNGTSEVRSPDVGSADFLALPVPGGYEISGPNSGGTTASSSPRIPQPFAPGGPLSGLASASATAGAGALVPLLAALAAALLLAAPGLGRRLRPGLAPWPQPILPLSLERPG